ncbi:MAG TPA: zf-HC2 domain-containing protein [Candidatus Saccharimonadales bacterium]|nr:zf-HC2 domain-containing protein [Candidatus Saccharimonadales bacterium]
MHSHPEGDLSAYADESSAPERTAELTAHLAGCARCARRVDELRAVRGLVAAAPAPRPSRSLLPRLSRAPAWLRPARSLASVGAGTFLFLFLASAVLNSGSNLGGGTTAAERAAARGQLNLPAASDSARADAARATGATGPAVAAPAASQGTPGAVGNTPPGPRAVPAGEQVAAARREFGPPAWLFALLAMGSAGLALGLHRRLRRS